MTVDPEDLKDPRLAQGLAYWYRIRGDRRMPSRRDIRPGEILALLPHVFLVDVLRPPLRFRIRLAGTEIVNRFGEEITGRTLEEIDLAHRGPAIAAIYAAAIADRAPVLSHEEFLRRDGRFMHYRRLVCPLSSDGMLVDMLFGVLATTPLVER